MLATGSLRRVIAAGAVAVTLVGLGGASAALHGDHNAAGPRHIARRSVDNSHYCDGCSPPLVYNGGPVADTSGPNGFTVIPIFWAPQGYTYPPNYVKAVSGYIKNLAAASGQTSNVVSIAREYFQKTSSGKVNLRYRITAGHADRRRRIPIRQAAASSQMQRLQSVRHRRTAPGRSWSQGIAASGLPTGLSVFYPVFFPSGVETQDRDGSNFRQHFYCGYHRSYGTGANVVLYGNEPLETSGCDGGQTPNGSVVIEGAISVFSHELLETMTDPADQPAWVDASGSEIADICASYYGTPLGSTDPNNAGSTQYNQVVNGGKYYIADGVQQFRLRQARGRKRLPAEREDGGLHEAGHEHQPRDHHLPGLSELAPEPTAGRRPTTRCSSPTGRTSGFRAIRSPFPRTSCRGRGAAAP